MAKQSEIAQYAKVERLSDQVKGFIVFVEPTHFQINYDDGSIHIIENNCKEDLETFKIIG